jgi:hypothetical protein
MWLRKWYSAPHPASHCLGNACFIGLEVNPLVAVVWLFLSKYKKSLVEEAGIMKKSR